MEIRPNLWIWSSIYYFFSRFYQYRNDYRIATSHWYSTSFYFIRRIQYVCLHFTSFDISTIGQYQKTRAAIICLSFMKQVFSYFIQVFKKNGPHQAPNFNLKVMHGINKVSIILFLFCVLVMLYRAIF